MSSISRKVKRKLGIKSTVLADKNEVERLQAKKFGFAEYLHLHATKGYRIRPV
jgi:hypothetical protein